MPPTNQPESNAEIRQWYLRQIVEIPRLNQGWIAQGRTAVDRAQEAWRIRHQARLLARSMMINQTEVQLLRARDTAKYGNPDGPTFELLVAKLSSIGLEGDAIYEAIVDNSYRTDAELNRKLGL